MGERTRLDHRVLDLRVRIIPCSVVFIRSVALVPSFVITPSAGIHALVSTYDSCFPQSPAAQSIFRIQAGVCDLFRSFLTERRFTEIHSPKLQGSSTESGAAVFKVDYFRRPAYLAQSPQLAKQMCIAADMERVFEIGPVFRAENSNTHRHLTEFTGLDLEMAIDSHYYEVLELLDDLLKFVFKSLLERFRVEVSCSYIRLCRLNPEQCVSDRHRKAVLPPR